MGYWCLFWRDDLPGWLYVSQKELYLPVWAGISLLTMLPLLKKGRRGMLPPALALLYLVCCFIAIKRVPKEEKKEETEPEESGTF